MTTKPKNKQGKKKAKRILSRSRVSQARGAAVRGRRINRGVVTYYVSGQKSGVSSRFTASNLIKELRAGLSVDELDDLQATLDVPRARLAKLLNISNATLNRRKADGRLGMAESDRVVRFARLAGRAIDVFESEEGARRWLNSPQVGLGGEVPLDYAQTEMGAREVEDLLGRIEYGVYA